MNQFATPGLGSLMGRRIIPGLGQLLLFLFGFLLFLFWFVRTMHTEFSLLTGDVDVPPGVHMIRIDLTDTQGRSTTVVMKIQVAAK